MSDTQAEANKLVNVLTNKPSTLNVLVNKLSLLKNNLNKKYVVIGIIVVVLVVSVILYLQYKKNVNFLKNKYLSNKPKYNKNQTVTADDDDEEPQPQPKKQKPQKPQKKELSKEPDHLQNLDLTNDEIKVIEDELNNQSADNDNVDE